MIGTMASIMSSTVVNVAIPDMSHNFLLGTGRTQWVTSGFMIAMTVSMLTTPWLLSKYGYRRTYVFSMALLLLGGVAGGLSNSFELVLVARVTEGLAAGVVQPIPAIIIIRAFDHREQGRASGIFGMGVVLAPAIGPSIGGILVDAFGWRSIFFMVVPFCIISIWLAFRYVPISAPGGVAANSNRNSLDWRGLMLGCIGTLCLINGLLEMHEGTLFAGSILLLGVLLSLIVFVGWQHRLAKTNREPLMNLALFSNRQFVMGSIVAFIYGSALFGSTFLFPLYIQIGLGMSATSVGAILLPAGLILAISIAFAGRLVDRYPIYLLVSLGIALLSLSFATLLIVTTNSSIWLVVALAILGRIGLGFILPSLNLGALRLIEPYLISQGASVINFVRMLGGAIGVSVCSIILDWRLAAHNEILTLSPIISPARLAAFNESFAILAIVCAFALIAAWNLRETQNS